MRGRRVLKGLLAAENVLLAGLLVSIMTSAINLGRGLIFYEVFGALMAATITTFGLLRMKQLTDS